MADVNSTLTDVCNEIALALQTKLNTTGKFKPINYAANILSIGTEANVLASDVKSGKKAYVGNGYINGTFTGVDLSVTPSKNAIVKTPVASQYFKRVTVEGDQNLLSQNIKSGVSIFGVTGSYNPQPMLLTPTTHLLKSVGTVVAVSQDEAGQYIEFYKDNLHHSMEPLGLIDDHDGMMYGHMWLEHVYTPPAGGWTGLSFIAYNSVGYELHCNTVMIVNDNDLSDNFKAPYVAFSSGQIMLPVYSLTSGEFFSDYSRLIRFDVPTSFSIWRQIAVISRCATTNYSAGSSYKSRELSYFAMTSFSPSVN